MALAANALTSVATLKRELGIGDGEGAETDVLERAINVASGACERYCKRTFGRGTVTSERVKGFGTQLLMLARTPVVSITSIVLDTVTIDATSYYVQNAEAGLVFSRVPWVNTAAWLSEAGPTQLAGSEEAAYLVTYVGGYYLPASTDRDLPHELEHAALLSAIGIYRGRGKYQKLLAETEEGDNKPWYDYALPPNARQLLNAFKRLS